MSAQIRAVLAEERAREPAIAPCPAMPLLTDAMCDGMDDMMEATDSLRISRARLMELFHYNPETGIVTRRISRGPRPAGSQVGYRHQGYIKASIDRLTIGVHVIAWIYMTGALPSGVVDHRNGDGTDNSWSNLRDVTHAVNLQNQRFARSDNRSGFLGVCKMKNGRFAARIGIEGRNKSLGTYPTAELAHEAYVVAKRLMHEGNTL